jgi:hypothetical protein
MIKFIARFIVIFIFCLALIFGAWLAGADPSAWTFILAAWFSALVAGFVTLFEAVEQRNK